MQLWKLIQTIIYILYKQFRYYTNNLYIVQAIYILCKQFIYYANNSYIVPTI